MSINEIRETQIVQNRVYAFLKGADSSYNIPLDEFNFFTKVRHDYVTSDLPDMTGLSGR